MQFRFTLNLSTCYFVLGLCTSLTPEWISIQTKMTKQKKTKTKEQEEEGEEEEAGGGWGEEEEEEEQKKKKSGADAAVKDELFTFLRFLGCFIYFSLIQATDSQSR